MVCRACSVGETSWLGGAPGLGGRSEKSGGIASGAPCTTANSSGTTFSMPNARFRSVQPLNDGETSANAQSERMIGRVDMAGSILLIRRFASGTQAIDHHEEDADGDRRIREIEGEKMPARQIKVEEIDDRAAHRAVDR